MDDDHLLTTKVPRALEAKTKLFGLLHSIIILNELIGSTYNGQPQTARASEPLERMLVGCVGDVPAIPC